MIVLASSVPYQWRSRREPLTMPSLFRFLLVVGILGGLAYGAMFALAHYVEVTPRDITVSVPPDRFFKNR
jgi:hypothetical protein